MLRAVVLAAALIETLAVGVPTWWRLNEGTGIRIAAPLARIALFVFAVTALPATALALMGRHLWASAVLVTLPLALAAYGRFG